MSDTVKLNHCPKCDAPIPAGAPQGLCPKCVLLGAATATEAGAPATATAEVPSLARVAAAFPQLEILELIGRGGMGFVFKARQPHLDRFVALKLLPDKLARDPRFAERFNREGRVLARLNHPNIVSVYDFGQTEHFYFLLMEFVDGVNLRQAMKAGRFSPAEALAIVPKICEALQYAHGQGILHRDIKPENILLDARGQVKIADFGIAKLVGEDSKLEVTLTGTGAALGTPHYMAPEQLEKPAEVDHRADIYSLGVVFYEMLTGELPIGRFAAPSAKTPVGANVDEVVFRTLEKDRERRYQSAGEMKTHVEHLTDAGAGSFQGTPPKLSGAETVVATKLSQKAVWGSVLTGASLPIPVLWLALAYLAKGGQSLFGVWELIIAAVMICLPGLTGIVLGWMALRDIRARQGRLRGLPLAVFAALTWPLLVLIGITVTIPWLLAHRSAGPGTMMPPAVLLMVLVPVATITFAIWTVYAAVHWGANKPPTHRRGVLKLVFLGLLLATVVLFVAREFLRSEASPSTAVAVAADGRTTPTGPTSAAPWIDFSITRVELREEADPAHAKATKYWLDMDYLADAHGAAEQTFLCEASIPGFKAEVHTGEKVSDSKGNPLHERPLVEFLLPPMTENASEVYDFRTRVKRALEHRTFRLAVGEERVLFEVPNPAGASLKARVKVVPPLKIPAGEPAVVFGPEIETTVINLFSGGAPLALDRKQAISLPPGSKQWGRTQLLLWLAGEGVDLAPIYYDDDQYGWGFAMRQTISRIDNRTWQTLAPQALENALAHPDTGLEKIDASANGMGLFRVYPHLVPLSFAVRTSQGRLAALQVTGFTENPNGVRIRYKMVRAATMGRSEDHGPSRKLELGVPTLENDSYWSLMMTTCSELPAGDYLVGLLKRPDGRVEELSASTTIYGGSTQARTMRHLLWPMSQFESNRVREIGDGMRKALNGLVIELKPGGRTRVFVATNVHGQVTEGFIALRSQSFNATNFPPVSVSIFDAPQNWSSFLSVKLQISAPSGYLPSAVGMRSNGSELETHTSIMRGGAGSTWAGDSCLWYFPQEFQPSDVKEIIRQLEVTKITSPNGIRILPGQQVPVFSVTNQTGTIFRGFFKLPDLSETQ